MSSPLTDSEVHARWMNRTRSEVEIGKLTQHFLPAVEEVMLIDPAAIGRAFFPSFLGPDEAAFERKGPVGVVSIDGPLMQRAGWFWDGYDQVRARFEKALGDSETKAVVLRINSPGGMCAGCFEAVDAMVAAKRKVGKRVFAFADETAASAAYAIASVADEIWAPRAGRVGSIGTVITLAEYSEQLAKMGVRVAVIATGKQKTDGNPMVALTDDVVQRFRDIANHLNSLFVNQVAASRGMTPAQVLALDAAVLFAEAAVTAKIADGVSSYDAFLSMVESKTKVSPPRAAVAARVAVEDRKMGNEDTTAAPVNGASATLALVAATLGMSTLASERDVQARVRELADAERDLLRVTIKGSVAEALGAVQGWKVSHDALATTQTELAELRAKETGRELDVLIESAKAAGKITNETLEKTCRAIGASSPAQLRALVETLPVVGGGVLRREASVEVGTNAQLTAADIETARVLGLTAEEMAATRRDELARKAG